MKKVSAEKVLDYIDKTIICVSKEINRKNVKEDEYAKTVAALAKMMEARATLELSMGNICVDR